MATTVHPNSPDPTATTTTPPSPSPPPPQENPPSSADAAEPAAVVGSGGGEIAALDQQLAVVGGAGVAEEGKSPPGGGKLVAEAMRKHAAPRSSRYHGVTRLKWSGKYEAHLWDNASQVEGRKRKGKHGAYFVASLQRLRIVQGSSVSIELPVV
uniref:Uncharacterized protein n=1 Tax=Avena sativa TaxID=4498 RepID=A0ACD5ZXR6_AVESA